MDILKDGIILHSTKKMDIDVTCNLPARPKIDVDETERFPSFLRSSLSKDGGTRQLVKPCPYRKCHPCRPKPSKIYSHYWIYEDDPTFQHPACKICPHTTWTNGHWMMFFPCSMIDDKWEQVVDLYRRGLLTGVQAMKVGQEVSAVCLHYLSIYWCLFTFFSGIYQERKHQSCIYARKEMPCDLILLWTF